MRMVAAVLGGGTGQRIGAPLPKQLLTLGGRTLIEHCVAAFEQAPGIDEVLVLMASGYVGQVRAMLADAGYGKVTAVIEGGATRADSTRVALAAISRDIARDSGDPADCGVLLHDAARPLVDQQIIADCVAALAVYEAAGVAVPASDTMVIAEGGVMHSMPRRETLWRCQTPQCFRLPVITRAHELAAADSGTSTNTDALVGAGLSAGPSPAADTSPTADPGRAADTGRAADPGPAADPGRAVFAPTDDCGVVLRYLPGVQVHIVPGTERNMKITYPQDLAVAEELLAMDVRVRPA